MKRYPYANHIVKQSLIITGIILITQLLLNALTTRGFVHHVGLQLIILLTPILVTMGIISYKQTQSSLQYIDYFAKILRKVADGDFSIRLETNHPGPQTDIHTSFNKMVQELENTHTLRTDFINHFSHEFKTPITSIHGFATLLLERDIPVDDQKRYLQIISDEANRLSHIANNTLMFSKLSSQAIITDKSDYALDEQIRQCAILLAPKWYPKHIDLQSDLESVIYHGNADLMYHIWLNLISNAIKFTPEYGSIHLSLTQTDNKILFKIIDTGQGMSDEIQSHIFKPYFQAQENDQAHLATPNGLGLGLSIVQKIVQLCDGEISVESILGEGTVIDIKL